MDYFIQTETASLHAEALTQVQDALLPQDMNDLARRQADRNPSVDPDVIRNLHQANLEVLRQQEEIAEVLQVQRLAQEEAAAARAEVSVLQDRVEALEDQIQDLEQERQAGNAGN